MGQWHDKYAILCVDCSLHLCNREPCIGMSNRNILSSAPLVVMAYIEKADPLSKTSVSSCSASASGIASISRNCSKVAKFGGISVFCRCSL